MYLNICVDICELYKNTENETKIYVEVCNGYMEFKIK